MAVIKQNRDQKLEKTTVSVFDSCRYYTILLAILLVLPFGESMAQKYLNEGNKYFDRNLFEEAIPLYLKELDKGTFKTKNAAREKLASCYRLTGRFLEANKTYKQVLEKGGKTNKPENTLNYANSLKSSAEYAEAAVQFENYITLMPNDPMGKVYLESCHMVQQWLDLPEESYVNNFDKINTEGTDFAPFYYNDGIVFTSDREGSTKKFINLSETNSALGTDLYYIDLLQLNSENNIIQNLSEINSYANDGTATFSPDQKRIYFARTVIGKKNKKNNAVLNSLQVFYSEQNSEGFWSRPVSAFSFNSEKYSVGQPCVAPDGKRIYFFSDMPGGMGKADIYYANMQPDGTWGDPINIGAPVNTFGEELFPFLASNDSLFFSSDTHPGMGKLDIFLATKTDNGWENIVNLKPPVNSIGDDFSFILKRGKNMGFFSSDRDNGKGKEDIYTYYKEGTINLEFIGTKLRIPDNSIFSGLSYKIAEEGQAESVPLVSDNGYFNYMLKENTSYKLTLRKSGFSYDQVKIKLKTPPEKEYFLAELSSQNSSLLIGGVLADQITKIIPGVITPKSKEPTSDTIIELKPLPEYSILLQENSGGVKDFKTITNNTGNYTISDTLFKSKVYSLHAFKEMKKIAQENKPQVLKPVAASVKKDTIPATLPKTIQKPVQKEIAQIAVIKNDTIAKQDTTVKRNPPVQSNPVAQSSNIIKPDTIVKHDTIVKTIVLPPATQTATADKQPQIINIRGAVKDIRNNNILTECFVKIINDGNEIFETITNLEGVFKIYVPKSTNYQVIVTKIGYFQKQTSVPAAKVTSTDKIYEILLEPIVVNKTVAVNNILFDLNREDLKKESIIELDKLKDFLLINSDISIELNAHTDTRGDYYLNLQLSEKRAESVKKYLANQGIDQSRIITHGFGETFPLFADAKTEYDNGKNRRVEFRIIEKKNAESQYVNLPKGIFILSDCPYSNKKPVPEVSQVPPGTSYRINMGEYRNYLPADFFKGLFPVVMTIDPQNDSLKYTAGYFTTLEEAQNALEIIRSNFYKDASLITAVGKNQLPGELTDESPKIIAEAEPENPNPVNSDLPQKGSSPYFSLQIGAFKTTISSTTIRKYETLIKGYDIVTSNFDENIILSVGKFSTYEEAFSAQKSLMESRKIKENFIIAIHEGMKISVKEGKRLLNM